MLVYLRVLVCHFFYFLKLTKTFAKVAKTSAWCPMLCPIKLFLVLVQDDIGSGNQKMCSFFWRERGNGGGFRRPEPRIQRLINYLRHKINQQDNFLWFRGQQAGRAAPQWLASLFTCARVTANWWEEVQTLDLTLDLEEMWRMKDVRGKKSNSESF